MYSAHSHTDTTNMMDLLKTNMMSMFMFSSVNSGRGSTGTDGGNGVYGMLYVFLITGIVDFVCKHVGPFVAAQVRDYYQKQVTKTTNLFTECVGPIEQPNKTASIVVSININDQQNIIGQALLDYVTNNKHTKHISYKNHNFILNQFDVIEICDEIFIQSNPPVASPEKSGEGVQPNSGMIEQTIELFSYTKSMKDVRLFLDQITYDYRIKIENKLGNKIFFFNQHQMNAPSTITPGGVVKDYSRLPSHCVFTMKQFQTNRKFENLFGPEIEAVRKRVEFFISNRKWYDSKGIPYTLGLLLSGQAGSGKTSTIKCLANETNRHIININLNNDITKTQLDHLFFNELISVLNISSGQTEKYYIPLDQRVYVLEDIDCQRDMVYERSNTNSLSAVESIYAHKQTTVPEDSNKIDLSFLLNLLDGVLETPGRIVLITSNYPELLDHALIRPGRIDVIADFKKCTYTTVIEMIEFFYDAELSELEKDIIRSMSEYIISPAELSKIMFENFNNYHHVFSRLAKMDEEIKRIKAERIKAEETERINEAEEAEQKLNKELFNEVI